MTATVMVIEDNPANLELIRYLLTSHQYRVITAHHGEQALMLMPAEKPDLIICDIQLPVMDGFELAARLKKDPVLSQIPLIAVTAYAMEQDRLRILQGGFDSYITKPIAPEMFIEEIRELMEPDATKSRQASKP